MILDQHDRGMLIVIGLLLLFALLSWLQREK